ncbi:MAG TPA: hypothetical protein PLI16_03865 [Bacteroidales bacterium]|nr:hypothetical protein [Bacteroidales bacterium]HNZ43244.1 hypothetical protein [Bacteroidales bacterium]HOH83725.1 hypothetical protein [Bacteroidales bacterium]HPB25320.1 hypothetical protein [Bacteroidales bacterium]HPI29240.1 hypothetical protein [Bacteroidales bacterium]
MKIFEKIKLTFLILLVVCLVGCVIFRTGTFCWISIISFIALSIVSLLQAALFFNIEYKFWLLKYFLAITLSIHSFCFVALMLSYQQIGDWKNILIVTNVFFWINFLFLLIFFKHFLEKEIKKIFLINILIPALVIFFLGVIPLVVPESELYDNFNRERNHQTYDEYIERNDNHNPDQILTF